MTHLCPNYPILRIVSTTLDSVLGLWHFSASAVIPAVWKIDNIFHMNGSVHVDMDPFLKYQMYDTLSILYTEWIIT